MNLNNGNKIKMLPLAEVDKIALSAKWMETRNKEWERYKEKAREKKPLK